MTSVLLPLENPTLASHDRDRSDAFGGSISGAGSLTSSTLPSPLLTASTTTRPRSSTLHSATSSQTPLRRVASAALRRVSREYSVRGSDDFSAATTSATRFGPDGKFVPPPPLEPVPGFDDDLGTQTSGSGSRRGRVGGLAAGLKRRRGGGGDGGQAASLKAAQRAWQQTPEVGGQIGMSRASAVNAMQAASTANLHQPMPAQSAKAAAAGGGAGSQGVQIEMVRGSGYARYPTTKSSAPKTLRVEGQRVKGFKAVWRNFILGLRLKLYRFKKSLGLGGSTPAA